MSDPHSSQTNAKLGDYLGLNLWTAKSRYGATIQTALDYTMGLNPGSEDISDILPHVASVAAAYGDPTGKYAKFLKAKAPSYTSDPTWYYNQPEALTHAPASAKGGKSEARKRTDEVYRLEIRGLNSHATPTETAASTDASNTDDPSPIPTIPFECPQVFATAVEVLLDDGIFVSCDDLKPFYGYVDNSVS